MPTHHICSKVDRAIVAYLIAQGAGTADDVWPAKRSLNKTQDGTIVWSHSAIPPADDLYSGNRMVETFVEVRSLGVIEAEEGDDAPRLASDARVGATWDAFAALGDINASDKLAAEITDAARATGASDLQELTIQSVRIIAENQGFNPRSRFAEGQMWVDALHLQMLVSPANVD